METVNKDEEKGAVRVVGIAVWNGAKHKHTKELAQTTGRGHKGMSGAMYNGVGRAKK